jgi:hypothetical protein
MIWNESKFQKWLALREDFRSHKRDHCWEALIVTGEQIIDLAEDAKFIGIMVPLFQKDIGYAWQKLGDVDRAVHFYNLAKSGLLKYRAEEKLYKLDDWLDTIGVIDRKIGRMLESKKKF